MPYYRIKSRYERKRLWFVPIRRFTFDEDIEAPTARDAVLKFMAERKVGLLAMARGHVGVDPNLPVRASPVLHSWLAPKTVTVAEYVDWFLAHQWRSFAFRVGEDFCRRILSVKETDTVTCMVCQATGLYKDTDDVCFACKGDGRITPALAGLLNRDLAAQIRRRGIDQLGGSEEWSNAVRQIIDELQYGIRTLSSEGDSE